MMNQTFNSNNNMLSNKFVLPTVIPIAVPPILPVLHPMQLGAQTTLPVPNITFTLPRTRSPPQIFPQPQPQSTLAFNMRPTQFFMMQSNGAVVSVDPNTVLFD
eukprot:UN32514